MPIGSAADRGLAPGGFDEDLTKAIRRPRQHRARPDGSLTRRGPPGSGEEAGEPVGLVERDEADIYPELPFRGSGAVRPGTDIGAADGRAEQIRSPGT